MLKLKMFAKPPHIDTLPAHQELAMSARVAPEQASFLQNLLSADLRGLEDQTSWHPAGPSHYPHIHSGQHPIYHWHLYHCHLLPHVMMVIIIFFTRSLPIAVIQHGGLAFLLIYLICLTVVGAPLLLLETTLGKNFMIWMVHYLVESTAFFPGCFVSFTSRSVLGASPSSSIPPPLSNPGRPWSGLRAPSRPQSHP